MALSGLERVLQAESLHGARIANRLRYFFCFVGCVIVAAAVWRQGGSQLSNYLILSGYLVGIILQTIALSRGAPRLTIVMQYYGIILDYAVVFGLTLLYTVNSSPDNFSFGVKVSSFFYVLIPIGATLFQFQIRFVVFSSIAAVVMHSFFALTALWQGVPSTQNFYESVNGPAAVIPDLLFTRPGAILCLAACMGYAIYRSRKLAERMAQSEAKRAILSRYFSPQVTEELTADPDVMKHPSRMWAAIFFLDIRGFTAMSEGLPPEDVAGFLSEFREIVLGVIFANNGTVDKYIGDAVMAVFGVPTPGSRIDIARDAVSAARQVLARVEAQNTAGWTHVKTPIRIGIGLHAGQVVAGSIGSGAHLEYTVLGDAVNTASRIESLCKEYDAQLLVSDEVVRDLPPKETGNSEKLPPVPVKGKKEPITLYKFL